MINPIGSFLTTFDQTLGSSMNVLIERTTSMVEAPVLAAAALFYVVQGIKIANGDADPVRTFVPQTLRILTVIWLSTNLGAFHTWVVDLFFTGLPTFLNGGVSGIGGPDGSSVDLGGVTATAAVFDQLWSQMWIVVGTAKAQAGMLDFGTGTAAELAGFTGGAGLMVMALIYICARFILALVMIAAPVLIALAMHDVTKPFFERGVGLMVSLIFLQFVGIIVLQLVLTGDQIFMNQIIAASQAREAAEAAAPWYQFGVSASSGAAMATITQNLVAMVVWLLAGAFAMYVLPAVAYSIGTGIAISTAPALAGTALSMQAVVKTLTTIADRLQQMPLPSMPNGGGGSNLSLSMPPKALTGPGHALPPPPPPPMIGARR